MTALSFAVLGYLVVQLAIGVWAARFQKQESDYFLAGRQLGFAAVAISLFATWFGAETVLGSSAAIAEEGLAGARADPFGYSLCLLGMALFLAYQMRARNYVTVGDLFRARYSRSAEILGSLLFVPSVVTWAGAQLLAFGHLLSLATGLPFQVTLVIATLIVITYTTLGGLLGDVITDVLQGSVILIGLVVLLVLVLAQVGGPAAILQIPLEKLSFVAPDESLLARLDFWAVPVLGSLISQVALARMLAARSPGIARAGAFGAFGLYITIGLIPVIVTLVGSGLIMLPEDIDQFLPTLAREIMPPWLFVVFLGALISAILSTVDSTLLTVSALVTHNIILPMRRDLGEAARVRLARAVVILTGLIAYMIAVAGDSILGLVILADSLGTSGLLTVVLFGLYTTRFGGPVAALTSFTAGLVAFPMASFVFEAEAPFLISLSLSLAAYIGGAFLERQGMLQPRPG